MSESDYQELSCCKCGTIHWIPSGLWDSCQMTRNDLHPVTAYCPYGHRYAASGDKINEQDEILPPAPVKRKKPRRFWEKKEKDQNEDNVIKFKGGA